eukprot:TRINITY_DN962_c0_g2_i1.p1 TRINITY_DN962_c0_g2~~TRINITY_DN962_c0_g2_i1.p1  ORF type:complete len:151 (-),score=16.67 TRINITY_DN962_c0_g2_i1:357-809(-)
MNNDKVLKLAKGFRNRAGNCRSIARERVDKSLQYAYVGRKLKKRQFRTLWVTHINAAVRQYDIKYSHFMHGCVLANISLDRKILADIAVHEPYSFRAVTLIAKEALENEWGTLKPLSSPFKTALINAKLAEAMELNNKMGAIGGKIINNS